MASPCSGARCQGESSRDSSAISDLNEAPQAEHRGVEDEEGNILWIGRLGKVRFALGGLGSLGEALAEALSSFECRRRVCFREVDGKRLILLLNGVGLEAQASGNSD